MSDNKQQKDGRDAAKIDLHDAGEVEYVHSLFPALKHGQVVEAIKKMGPGREAVYAYLRKQ